MIAKLQTFKWMQLEKETINLLQEAVEKLGEGFELPPLNNTHDYDAMRGILNQVAEKLTEAGVLTFQENVPPYPQQPANSRYIRTGETGRRLGSGQSGGKIGEPDIKLVRKMGNDWLGAMGSKSNYAQWVIGNDTQASQNSHWWRMKDIAKRSANKIQSLANKAANQMVKFLNGR